MSKTTRRVYKIAAAAAFTAGSVAAIPATFAAEAPADQQQQVVDQKATAQASSLPGGNATETPKAEAPKTEAPKAETPKAEAPKADATEAPKAEAPKTEAPKAEATEAPKAEAPKAEAPKTETPKAEATEAPKAETPKAETPKAEAPKADATEAPKAETPAPTAPATPEPTPPSTPTPEAKQADPSIVIEDARFPGNAQLNTVSVVGTGFYGEKVGPGVQVSIYALDADNQITGEALATVVVPAEQIQDGTFKASITVEASKLPAGASYALAAVSNPQGQPNEKLVAISSFKVTESTSPEAPKNEETPAPVTPAPETPKADETPAPVTPAPEAPKTETPKEETPAPEAPKAETPAPEAPKTETPAPEAPAAPENATLTTEDASLDPNDQYNVLTFNGSGFTHESVANGVQIAIYRLDANGNITGEALATHDVPASEIVNGTFRVKVSVLAELLQPGYAYAMVATSDPNGLVHQVAVTTATVSDANNPAPTLPAATEGDNTTVRDNGDGTTSVFTAEMREDGSVVVTETRMPSSQAPKAKVGNASAATSSSSNGHTVGVSGTKGSTSTSSSASSKPQLANTGAEGVAGIAGVGAAALIAGAALMLLRRRSL